LKIVFLGPPGAGKGTYSSRISKILNIPHISTGDIFREAIMKRTELGKKVSDYVKNGDLVPDNVTVAILKERISQSDCQRGFILDGYPRTVVQAKELEKLTNLDVVINLEINENIILKKLSARRVCKSCGEIYNLADIQETINGIKYSMPPMLSKKPGICDKCEGELEQRKDDKMNVIRDRLELYRKQTEPLIIYYQKRGLLKKIIVNAGPDIVVPMIMEKLESLKNDKVDPEI